VVVETERRRNVIVQNMLRIKDRNLMFAAPIPGRQKAAGGARVATDWNSSFRISPHLQY
jgi:hypothetical protein